MIIRRALACLGWLLFVATGLAAEAKPFTPESDLKGSWEFTVDPRLPNVLLIGDSISIGYTRAVRERLRGKANVFRPMNGKAPDNFGDTRVGLRKIDTCLATQKWDVIHFNWGLHDLAFDRAGKQQVPLEQYEKNLRVLVKRLQAGIQDPGQSRQNSRNAFCSP